MKFVDFILLILLLASVAIGIIWLAIKAFRPSDEREVKRLNQEVKENRVRTNNAEATLWEIAKITERWSDIDHILASEIKATLNTYREKTRNLPT